MLEQKFVSLAVVDLQLNADEYLGKPPQKHVTGNASVRVVEDLHQLDVRNRDKQARLSFVKGLTVRQSSERGNQHHVADRFFNLYRRLDAAMKRDRGFRLFQTRGDSALDHERGEKAGGAGNAVFTVDQYPLAFVGLLLEPCQGFSNVIRRDESRVGGGNPLVRLTGMFARLISSRGLVSVGAANIQDCGDFFGIVMDQFVRVLLTAEPQVVNNVVHNLKNIKAGKTKRPKLKRVWDVRPKQPSPEVCSTIRVSERPNDGNGSDGLQVCSTLITIGLRLKSASAE